MGANTSKLEDDKALILCRERRRFVRQAVDGRCSFAESHVAYIQSLKRIGTALRKFVELAGNHAASESSLFSSTSAIPEPLALITKSMSHRSFSSASTPYRIDHVVLPSPTPSPPSNGHTQANYMKRILTPSTKVEEKPAALVTATMSSTLGSSRESKFRHRDEASFDIEIQPSQPEMPPWDYWGLFHPIDNQFSYQDGRDNMEDIGRLREEEGIPDLEEDGDKSTVYHKDEEYSESEDDFDDTSSSPLVQSYRRRADVMKSYSTSESPATSPIISTNPKSTQENGDKTSIKDGVDGVEKEVPKSLSSSSGSPSLSSASNGDVTSSSKDSSAENKPEPKDFLSSIREIENLFCRASDSGKEVLRMLEATEIQYRAMYSASKAGKPGVTMFFQACLACFEDPDRVTEVGEPPSSANEMKYLTWHGSTSSHSSSRNPIAADSKDENLDGGDPYRRFCMNSGSHASTLDRLYAWERKLYDEVKASGHIRREYELKCKLLRQQESQGERPTITDKTRASVKDLHSRIRVSIQRIGSISKKIEEIRDKELQPQLEELIEGLTNMWKTMLFSHTLQLNIISIAYNSGNSYFSLLSESHQQLTSFLGSELYSLRSSFATWINSQKSYVRAINNWLVKCVFPLQPKQQKSSKKRQEEFAPTKYLPPPIFVTCECWLVKLDSLQTREVENGIKGLETVITRFLPKQEKNQYKRLNSTLSWKDEGTDGAPANTFPRDQVPLDWNSGFASLKSSLTTFLEQLNSISRESFKMCVELKESIDKAKESYEKGARKKQ